MSSIKKDIKEALLAGCGSLKDDVNAVTIGCCTFASHESSKGILIQISRERDGLRFLYLGHERRSHEPKQKARTHGFSGNTDTRACSGASYG